MTDRSYARLVLLAFLVAVSHVALLSHVTAHFEPALEQCELCVSQAQPLAAIPASGPWIDAPPVAAASWPLPRAPRTGHPSPTPYLQRAPPGPSH